ncbi:MAG: GH92 family glycosyl hydrolase [Niabella sp.]
MAKTIISLFFLFSIVNFAGAQKKYTNYVNPLIGSDAHGHVFVGANVPFGAVQLGPVNIETGWNWCSGYHYSSNNIVGFSHTRLSGTGIGDMGDILLMPATGATIIQKGNSKDFSNGYTSTFSHKNETIKPGYYSVLLDKYNIKAELTATERTGIHRYTFNAPASQPHIVLDLVEGVAWDAPVEAYIEKINDQTISGYRFSKGWANNQQVYFTIKFSQPFTDVQLFNDTTSVTGTNLKAKKLRAVINFDNLEKKQLLVKVAISPVSIGNAQLNMNKEQPGWDFDKAVINADRKWNDELQKVQIDADERHMKVFYTALYHTMMAPSVFNDVNGDYRGSEPGRLVHSAAGFTNYTTYSLWDTYRAWHPLSTIIFPEKVNDIVNSMLAIYKQQGKLPVWHLMGNETNTMVGYHAVPVIVDAYLKGFSGFDAELAYEAVKQSAMQKTDGILYIQKLQFIPADSVNESVAKALEYAIDDWAIAQMAKAMNKKDDFTYFSKRAELYKQYFDKTIQFMRGRMADGSWRTPFDPLSSVHRKDDFVEGNAWQYTWLVPQDVEGLIKLFGGNKPFIKKIDSLFVVQGSMGAEASNDVTGLIGMYAQGNEPSHHITYMYAYAGQQWKTAELIRKIDHKFYTTQMDGLCGNEDVGQMSAWYIFSALGFYPVNPANGIYIFGTPLVKNALIKLPHNKTFEVKVVNASENNKYIQKVRLNNKNYKKSYITHQDITNGGTLTFYMQDTPSQFGVNKNLRPKSN